MAKFYYTQYNRFVDFPENQVSPSDIGVGKKYRKVDGAALTRYNQAVTDGIPPTAAYVFDNDSTYNDQIKLAQRKEELQTSLESNYATAVSTGIVRNTKRFSFDAETRADIVETNTIVVAEGGSVTSDVQLIDSDGELVSVQRSNWNTVFLAYMNAARTVEKNYYRKSKQIQKATQLSDLTNFDTSV